MNPGVEYYRPFGQPATATVVIKNVPAAADTVTIDGVVYTYGVDFVGSNELQVAQSLTAAVNGDRNRVDLAPTVITPIRSVYALYYGKTIRLIATIPGSVGNAITLATSTAANFTVSGATFSGGADSGSVAASGSPATIAPAGANALAKSLVVKASPGVLYSASVYNDDSVDNFLQLFDTASVPADAVVPKYTRRILSMDSGGFDFGSRGIALSIGIVLVLSSTDVTKTIVATNVGLFLAAYL